MKSDGKWEAQEDFMDELDSVFVEYGREGVPSFAFNRVIQNAMKQKDPEYRKKLIRLNRQKLSLDFI